MLEKRVKKFVLYICLSICICLLYGCKDAEEKKASDKEWNFSELLGKQDFSVDAKELGTAAKGTVICYERNPNVIELRLISFVSIGPEDWGGVAFYFPPGCELVDVLCTFPNHIEKFDNVSYFEIWNTGNTDGRYTLGVEVGRSHEYIPVGGGNGIIIIDALFHGDLDKGKELRFAVECGATYEDGTIIWGIDDDEVVVEISHIPEKGEK